MQATYIYGAGDVRVIEAPEPKIETPSDALVRVVRACVCGSDLHPYHSKEATDTGVSSDTNSSALSRRPDPRSPR